MRGNETIHSAIAQYQAGNMAKAEEICKRILTANPENAGLLNFLGVIDYQLKKYGPAEEYLTKALRFAPASSDIHYNLGNVYKDQREFERALSSYRRALELNPKSFEALHNIGVILQEKNELDEAIDSFKKALELKPDLTDAYYNLGTIFQDKEQWDEAAAYYGKAIQLDPNLADAYYNLGNVYRNKYDLDAAIECFQKAAHSGQNLVETYHNLGTAYQERGMYDLALEYLEKALKLNPELVDVKWNISMIHLSNGNFEQGWEEYESRWSMREAVPRSFSSPLWDGSPLDGKRLFIYDEQGIGDQVMFASCLPDASSLASSCIIETDIRLVPLYERSFPGVKILEHITGGSLFPADLQGVDVRVPVGSLPRFFRSHISDFPQRKSYLVPDPVKTELWLGRFSLLGEGFRVGISWRGGKTGAQRFARSTILEQWLDIFSIKGIQFINLQYGDCARELDEAKEKLGVRIHDWEDADPLKDLDNLASEIAALDLVISVDNATVHMAGALGAPVWTLLPYACDWRWMHEFEDTPWYPSMRLFRQSSYGVWDDVFGRVAGELEGAARRGRVAMEQWGSGLEKSFRKLSRK